MSDPKFLKPWHGIPRETIMWYPFLNQDACTGCGSCVISCGRLVFRYDFIERKAIIVDPFHCMVGCATCANTCPTQAIKFPALSMVLKLVEQAHVHHVINQDLLARREQLEFKGSIPTNNENKT
jgi:CDP-4-dehydro-6-deoxyglucose reductase